MTFIGAETNGSFRHPRKNNKIKKDKTMPESEKSETRKSLTLSLAEEIKKEIDEKQTRKGYKTAEEEEQDLIAFQKQLENFR